jgi:hypothetical protein
MYSVAWRILRLASRASTRNATGASAASARLEAITQLTVLASPIIVREIECIDLILILIENGVGKLGSILSPHNLGEFLIIILAVLPGWGLIWLARRIELRREKVAKLPGARNLEK